MLYEDRVWVAMRLARDVDACGALLRGEPVSADRLDPKGVEWAKQMEFVRLDFAAIDAFSRQLSRTAEPDADRRSLPLPFPLITEWA